MSPEALTRKGTISYMCFIVLNFSSVTMKVKAEDMVDTAFVLSLPVSHWIEYHRS